MTIYRGLGKMYKKYTLKYKGTIVGTRFDDVKDVALENFQEGTSAVTTVRELIRPVLDQYGITGGNRATYLAFALKLLRHVLRQKSEAAKKIASGLKQYFVTAYGLDPAVCDEIIDVVVGWAAAY